MIKKNRVCILCGVTIKHGKRCFECRNEDLDRKHLKYYGPEEKRKIGPFKSVLKDEEVLRF